MSDGYYRTVEGLGHKLMVAQHEQQAARQRFYDALEPLEEYILPRETRQYEEKTDLQQQVAYGSREAKKILTENGDVDAAAKAVSRELLELDGHHPKNIHNWIAERTAERLGENE